MSNLIAVGAASDSFLFNRLLPNRSQFMSNLKQQLLLFDKVGIYGLDFFKDQIDKQELPHIEWLIENNLIFNLALEDINNIDINDFYQHLENNGAGDAFIDLAINKANEFDKFFDGKDVTEIKANGEDALAEFVNDFYKNMRERDTFLVRYLCYWVEFHNKTNSVSLLPWTSYTSILPSSKKSDILRLVINHLPILNSTTSFEQILDYRSDEEQRNSLLSLRRWIRKISSENLSVNEIEEELEWLINQFEKHIKLHKLKTNTETLEIIVKAPLEVMENLIKIKWSKLPEPLFALRKQQISLLDAEINSPGNEIAYLIKTKSHFQSNE